MTPPCESCELLREMGADLLSERNEARAERDGAIRAMDTATECMNNRDAELDNEMDHSQDLAKRVERLLVENRRLRENAQAYTRMDAENDRLREVLDGMVGRFDRAFTEDKHEVEIHYFMCIEAARRALD